LHLPKKDFPRLSWETADIFVAAYGSFDQLRMWSELSAPYRHAPSALHILNSTDQVAVVSDCNATDLWIIS
jgi:hypothetical protein